MARPVSPDYDKRRERLVRAAARLFASQGFRGASMSDLARHCSTSKSLVYHYFPSKEDLLHRVMAAHLDALVEATGESTRKGSPEERLRALTRAFLNLYVEAQDSQKVLLNELGNLPAEQRRQVVEKQRKIVAAVEALIQEMRPDAGAEARPLAMLFFGMINWTHNWYRPDGRVPPGALADMAVGLLLSGIDGVKLGERLQAS